MFKKTIHTFLLSTIILISLGIVCMTKVISLEPSKEVEMIKFEPEEPLMAQLFVEKNGTLNEYLTEESDILSAIDALGIKLNENSKLSLADDTPLVKGQSYHLVIEDKQQHVAIYAGFNIPIYQYHKDGKLSRSGLTVAQDLEMETNDTVLEITTQKQHLLNYVQKEIKEFIQTQNISYKSEVVKDDSMPIGEKKIKTAGQHGIKELIYNDIYENGVFIERQHLREEIKSEPVTEVILIGNKPEVKPEPKPEPKVEQQPAKVNSSPKPNGSASSNFNRISALLNYNGGLTYSSFSDNGDGTLTVDGETFNYISNEYRVVTQYDGQETGNMNTASGLIAQRGIIASKDLAMGTIVFIEGYGLGVVADRHGMADTQLLDACFDPGEATDGTAKIGKRSMNIYIIES